MRLYAWWPNERTVVITFNFMEIELADDYFTLSYNLLWCIINRLNLKYESRVWTIIVNVPLFVYEIVKNIYANKFGTKVISIKFNHFLVGANGLGNWYDLCLMYRVIIGSYYRIYEIRMESDKILHVILWLPKNMGRHFEDSNQCEPYGSI